MIHPQIYLRNSEPGFGSFGSFGSFWSFWSFWSFGGFGSFGSFPGRWEQIWFVTTARIGSSHGLEIP